MVAASCFRAPESTITLTPVQEALSALADAEALAAGAEDDGGVAVGAEQAARLNRRPAAASELAAAVRRVVKVTS
ncbi:hypothetical protein ACU18_19005, partial [Arthrobacter sp. ZBG10]